MRISAKNPLILLFLLLSLTRMEAQRLYTPYDDLPGIIKSYKPAYEEGYPNWAKMLYAYPVNYFEVLEAYETYGAERARHFGAINRYYKLWSRAVASHAMEDGTIRLQLSVSNDQTRYYADNPGIKRHRDTRGNWEFLGPKETFWLNESGNEVEPSACPWQVNVYSFDVSASDPDILFAGTETGFVSRSHDKGLHWEMAGPDYFFGGGVTAVQIHPSNPGVVYVAAGNQVHKTVDGGDNWTALLPPGIEFHADRLKIDPSNPEKIIAAADKGVYISIDGGQSWQYPWSGRVWDVDIQPGDPEVVFALGSNAGEFTLVVSADGGASFSPHPAFPPGITDVSGGMLAVSPDDPDRLWCLLLSSGNTPLLYRLQLNNNSRELLATGQTGAFPLNNGQGYFDLVLEVSPLDSDVIFAGTTTLYKSTNGGQHFSIVGGYGGAFAIHPDIQDMKCLPNGETWVSTDGGFSITTDNFTDTQNYKARNNGLVGSDFWGFDQGWNEDIVVGGRYHNGNTAIAGFYQPKALRMGGAESPTGWVIQGKSRHVAFDDLGNGWILPETAEGMPGGRFIFSKFPNMDEYGGRRGNLVFHPNYYGTILLGEGNGLWKSTDLGTTYDLIHNFGGRVRFLQISYANPDVLYADVVGQGLMRSDDGGQNWEAKPLLTSGQFGNSYWNGKLFFVISPTDENKIYACLQNGTWSADIGKVFRSADGGDSWEDWTGGLNEYTKCLAIQPDSNGNDKVYLFTNAAYNNASRVYVRGDSDAEWTDFSQNFPAGMHVNLALPFYRDGKIRVAGNAGVWESPLDETEFLPLINLWTESTLVKCALDTLYFDDHSILNHSDVSWAWEITPAPAYIDDNNKRNPKVVLGNPGSYDVRLTVNKNGVDYERYIEAMITANSCPSIDDCSNPARLPKENWELIYVDSEEINYPGIATMAFDDDPSTIWHTRWSTGSDPYPHEMQFDLGERFHLFDFTVLNRQDGQNGRIRNYELYVSDDPEEWGEPVAAGNWENTAAPQTVEFPEMLTGQFVRLLALSEVNGNAWSSAAEFDITGCRVDDTREQTKNNLEDLYAFPVPVSSMVSISLPGTGKYTYQLITLSGQMLENGDTEGLEGNLSLDLGSYPEGIYLLILKDERGRNYRVKLVKQ